MFAKSWIHHISKLLLCSFLFLNLHSTAVALQEMQFRQNSPQFIVQTVMEPLLSSLLQQQEQQKKVVALRVLERIKGGYSIVHFFNFLADAVPLPEEEEEEYEVSEDEDFGDVLAPQRVYKGHIEALGDFVVAEDGSMIFRGDSEQRLSSIAFDTEKTLVLDHLNTEKAILSASQAILRSNASIESLVLHLQENTSASLHMLPGSSLQTREIDLQSGHFFNEGTLEFLEDGGLKVAEGTFYNQGRLHSAHKLSLEAKGLVNALSGIVEASQLECQINNAFNYGRLKSSRFMADIAGNFDQAGTIESTDFCSIKAQNYTQKGKLKASQALLKAENHSLQGAIESSSLKLHSNRSVEILEPLQGETLHFSGKGTVVNRAGIRTTQKLIFDNAQTENHAEIVSQGNLTISGSLTNHKSLIVDGEMQLNPQAILQNGTLDNKQATLTVGKAVFNKASFQNYGIAAFAHFYGDCADLGLHKESQLALQEADVKVDTLQHEGSLSLTSGRIHLQKESQWQAALLSLESNQATLKSNQAMTFHIPENFSWTQRGTLSASHLIFQGGSLFLKGKGFLQADTLTLNLPQLTNHNNTFDVKKDIQGSLSHLENREEIQAQRLELPQLKSFQNTSSGQVRFLSYELLGLTSFQNEGTFESDNDDKDSQEKPSSGNMKVSGAFSNSGTFRTRNLMLTTGTLTSTQSFLIPGASQIDVQKGIFQKHFEAQALTFKGQTLETTGTFKVIDRFYAPSLQNFTNNQNVVIGRFEAPQLTTLDVASWQSTSLKADSLNTIKSQVQFVDGSEKLSLPALKTLETKTFEAREVDCPQMTHLTSHHSFRLLSENQSIIKTQNFSNYGFFEGRARLESSSFSLNKEGILTLKGESELLSSSTLSVNGKINGESLTIQAPSLQIYGSAKGSVQGTHSLTLRNTTKIFSTGVLNTPHLQASNLTEIDHAGLWYVTDTLALPQLQNLKNSGTWHSGALHFNGLHIFQNSGTFEAHSPRDESTLVIQREFQNTGNLTMNAEIKTKDFNNTGTMTLPQTSSLLVSNVFEQSSQLLGDTLTVTVSRYGSHDMPTSAVYSGTSSLTLNFSGYWFENQGKILTQNLTYKGPTFYNYGVLEGLQRSSLTTSGTFENKAGSRTVLKNLTLTEGGTSRVFENQGELKIEGKVIWGPKISGINNSGTLILDTQAQEFGSFLNSGKVHLGGTYLGRQPGVKYPLTDREHRYHVNGTYRATTGALTFFDRGSCLGAQDFDEDGVSECQGKLILRQNSRVTKWGRVRAQDGVELEVSGAVDPVEALETLTVERGNLTLKTPLPVNFRKNLRLDMPLSVHTTSDVTVSAPLTAPQIDLHSRSFVGTNLIQSTNAPLIIQTTGPLKFGDYISHYPYSGKTNRREWQRKEETTLRPTNHSGTRTDYDRRWTDYSYTWPGHQDYRARGGATFYAPQGLFLTSNNGSIDLSYAQTFSRQNLEIRAPQGNIEAEGFKMDHLGDALFETNRMMVRRTAPLKETEQSHSEWCRNYYTKSFWAWTSGDWRQDSHSWHGDRDTHYYPLGDEALVTIKGNLTVKSRNSILLEGAHFCVEGYVSFGGCGTSYNSQEATRLRFFSLGEAPGLSSLLTIGQTLTLQADRGRFSGEIYARNASLQFAQGVKMTGSIASPQALVPYHRALPDALEGLKQVFQRTRGNKTTALAPLQPLSASKLSQKFIEEAYRTSQEQNRRQHYELSSLMAMTLEFLLPQVAGRRGFDTNFIQKVYQNGMKALRQGMSLTDIMRAGQSSIFLAPATTSWGESVFEPHLFVPIQDQQKTGRSGLYASENIDMDVEDDLGVSGYSIQAQGPVHIHVQGDFLHTPQTTTNLEYFQGTQVSATSVRQVSIFQGESLIMSIEGQFISRGGDIYRGGKGGLQIHSQGSMNITPQTESLTAISQKKEGKKATTTHFTEDRLVSQTRFEGLGPSTLTSGQKIQAQAIVMDFKEDLTIGGAKGTDISAQTLYDTFDEKSHLKRSWGRSTDTTAYRQQAQFVQSILHSGGKLVVISGEATFSGAAIQAKVITQKTPKMTFADQKAEQKAQGSETRHGVFSTESVTQKSLQDVMVPTTVVANLLESEVPGGLMTVLNSIVEADLLHLQGTNLDMESEPLRSSTETTQTTSGFCSKPLSTPVSMPHFESTHVTDILAGTAQTASTALGLVSDFRDMLHAKNLFDLLMTPLDRMLSVTIGSTKRKTFSEQKVSPAPVIKTRLMILDNDFVALKGHVTADEAQVTTKHFVVESLDDTETAQTTEKSQAASWNPLSLRKGFIGILPSVSWGSSTSTSSSITHRPSTLQVGQLYLHVDGDALVSGSQIVTKTAEALISGDLTVTSLLNHFEETTETTQGSASLAPIKAALVPGVNLREEQKHVLQQKIGELASIVGTEKFLLKVGETLLQRSADVGLRADGVPAGEKPEDILKAAKHVHEKLDEVDLSKTTVVNMLGGTALTLMGQLERTPRLLKDVKEILKSQGKSAEDIELAQQQTQELLQNPEMADLVDNHETALKEIENEVQELDHNLEQLEQKHESLSEVLKVETAAEATPTALETLRAQMESVDLATPEGQSLEYQIAAIDHDQKVQALSHKLLEKTAETVEKFESFLEKNPTVAKTLRYGVEGINGVLMITGVKGLVTSGLPKALVALGFGEVLSTASSWAGEKVEGLVADVATSESEAKRFMKALKTCAGTAGFVVGVKMAAKTTKSLKTAKNKAPAIKDVLSEKPIIKDGKVWLGDRELGEAAALNKSPYHPRKMEAMLKQGGADVTSSTLPPVNAKNVKLAGQRHSETRIVFDQRGFPIYDDITKAEVRISGDLSNMKSEAHMRAATKQLKVEIEAGRVDRKIFTDKQWLDIQDELPQISGFTWHHHQDRGRMQLVDRKIHRDTGHLGGNKLWGTGE